MHPFPPGTPGPYGTPGRYGARPALPPPPVPPPSASPPPTGHGVPPGGARAPAAPPSGPWGHPPGYYGPPGPYPPPGPQAAPPRSAAALLLGRIGAILLIALGLSIPFDDTCGWVSYPAWSAFAILAAIAALLPQFAASFGWSTPTGWLVGAAATGALLAFWVLIALPGIAGNAGFCLTVGVGAAVGTCWLSPGRRW